MVTPEQLQRLHIAPQWAEPLNATFERFNIRTPRQQAALLASVGMRAETSVCLKKTSTTVLPRC